MDILKHLQLKEPKYFDDVEVLNKKPLGRPSTYKPEYCEMLVEHMSKGYSFESFAANINTHRDTLYEWAKVNPDFSDSVKRGRDQSLKFWEAIGVQGTVGKLKGFSASGFALNMANKHKWLSHKTDITTDGQKIESPILYIPEEKE